MIIVKAMKGTTQMSKTVIEMALETGFDADDETTLSSLERFAELVRAEEREALETLYTDAHYIFNNPPGETSQDVRDVIEWYAAAIRNGSNT
jgi:hypothetical protein